MFQFTPLLLSQCLYLLTSANVDDSSMQTGVIMCQRWCERRSWCSEATYDPNSLQCSRKKKTPLSPGLTVIPIQGSTVKKTSIEVLIFFKDAKLDILLLQETHNTQHLCEQCPQHHVCLRTRSGATKCVKEDTTRESQAGQKIPKGVKHSALDKIQKCRGNIRYVQLLKTRIKGVVVYYDPYTTCPTEEQIKTGTEVDGMFDIECFREQKIYYWLMTLEIDRTVALKRTLSFQVAVTNVKHADYQILRYFKKKGITVTVYKKNLTFTSLEMRSKRRSSGPDEFVVVVDKMKGRLFLGTSEACYAMVEDDDDFISENDVCPFVLYPRGHLPTINKRSFDSIGSDNYDFTPEDVKRLMRRCEDSF